MSELDPCLGPKYTCGDTKEAEVANTSAWSITQTVVRTVTLTVGETEIFSQKRDRNYLYTDSSSIQWPNFSWITVPDSIPAQCVGDAVTSFTDTFADIYETVDIELLYLDIRNSTVVTREVKDTLRADDTTRMNPQPGNSVSVFTGFGSVYLHPVMFETIPIEEETKYKVYIKGASTELHAEALHRGVADINLLMPAFSRSSFGYRFNTAWAQDYEWYFQGDNRDTDGGIFLFWSKWHREAGRLNQVIDEFNRDLMNAILTRSESAWNQSGESENPRIKTAVLFKGSVAFDRDKNMFYSMALPNNGVYSDTNDKLCNNLVIFENETQVPTEMIGTGADEKESTYTCYFPIAPL